MNRFWSILVVSLIIIVAVFVSPAVVSAHAEPVRSEPAPNTVLQDSPAQVHIWFTEAVEGNLSATQVVDSSGNRVDNNDCSLAVNDPTEMTVTLKALSAGIYKVVWQTVSKIDGDSAIRSYNFSVRMTLSLSTTSSEPPISTVHGLVYKWLSLLGMLALAGGLFFWVFIIKPALVNSPALLNTLRRRVFSLWWFAGFLLLLSDVGSLIDHAVSLRQASLGNLSGSALSAIINTSWGHLILWRMALTLVIIVMFGLVIISKRTEFVKGKDVDIHSDRLWLWLTSFVTTGLLINFSLMSHLAAISNLSAQGVFISLVHLTAAGFWVGGLVCFTVNMSVLFRTPAPERTNILSGIAQRFYPVAILSAAVLIVTGLYSSWATLGTLSSLFQTQYGWSLVVKIILVVVLLCLSVLTFTRVIPQMVQSSTGAGRLRSSILREVFLGVLILLVVGLLASLSPTRAVASPIVPRWLILVLGLITAFSALLVIASCRGCISWVNTLFHKNIMQSKSYQSFFKYHTYYWWILGVSLAVHATAAISRTGIPLPGSQVQGAVVIDIILLLAIVIIVSLLAVFFSCRIFPKLMTLSGRKSPLTNMAYKSFYAFHSYLWWVFGAAAIVHIVLGVVHRGL